MKAYETPDFDKVLFDAEEVITASITIVTSDPDEDPNNPWSGIF